MTILFVCTGNYYRSRFAEIFFNYHTSAMGGIRAISRGLRLNPEKNAGVISTHTVAYLSELSIPVEDYGVPMWLEESDLQNATRTIILDEKEHRVMMQNKFPEWENKVEYWQFEDDYLVSPDIILPAIRQKVEELIQECSAQLTHNSKAEVPVNRVTQSPLS